MAKRPYMPLFIDRWRGGTESISPKHRGPYLDVLCAIWSGNGSLKNDPRVLRSASRLDVRQFQSFWAECSGKFLISSDEIRHQTVTEMLAASDKFAAKMQQNRARANKKPKAKQGTEKQVRDYHTKGMVSSLREEKPYLAIDEMKHAAASPPSPLEGGGDATETVQQIPTLPDAAREVLAQLRDLNMRGKVSLLEIQQFKKAVQGERSGRVLLIPAYEPPEAVAAVLNQPKLKAIEGGKQ